MQAEYVMRLLSQAKTLFQSGHLGDAEDKFREVLSEQPEHAEAHYYLGFLIAPRDVAKGLEHYQAALTADPSNPDYWLDYIEILMDTGNLEDAHQTMQMAKQHGLQGQRAQLLDSALDQENTILPEPSREHLDNFIACLNHGQLDEAETLARHLCEQYPRQGNSWKALGIALSIQERHLEALMAQITAARLLPREAESFFHLGLSFHYLHHPRNAEYCYQQALLINPDLAQAIHNLGLLHYDAGKLEQAEKFYRQALHVHPDHAQAHNNLGLCLYKMGEAVDAEQHIRRAIYLLPDYVEALGNLGAVLHTQGLFTQAESFFRQALEIKPQYPYALNNLGNLLQDMGRYNEAFEALSLALEINPNSAETHNNMGNLLQWQKQFTQAEACYRKALSLAPNNAEATNNLGTVLGELGRLEEAERCYQQALSLDPFHFQAHSNLLFTRNYMSTASPQECLELARTFGQKAAAKALRPFHSWHCDVMPKRLKIGLVSGDFLNHPVGYFLEGALSRMNPATLEIIAYPTHAQEDELTHRLKACCAAWRPIVGLTDERAAHLIHHDGVHLLVDLSGHTAHNRLPLFAWKPAPLQVSWLGYFATTGLAAMDYLLADPWTLPAAEEAYFTEAIWRLPNTRLCFTPPGTDSKVSSLPALQNGFVTFGCFNHLSKINETVVHTWSKILQRVGNSRLFLKSKHLGDPAMQRQVAQRFTDCGISPARLIMEGASPRGDYLAAYHRVDMMLDTFPFPGGTTTAEGLWMGVPVLTLAGERFLGRQGVGLLENAGLHNWVADNPQAYVEQAVAHAARVDNIARLRATLRTLVQASPIFAADNFAKDMETAFWQMWQNRGIPNLGAAEN